MHFSPPPADSLPLMHFGCITKVGRGVGPGAALVWCRRSASADPSDPLTEPCIRAC